jgi:hypothetical protein
MEDPQYNHYEFKNVDGDTSVLVTADVMLTSEVIDSFISFLRACSHSDKAIYEYMSAIAEEYFEIEEKRNSLLLQKFNISKPDLNIGLE